MTTAGQLTERFGFESRGPRDPSEPDDGNTQGDFVERFVVSAKRHFLRGTESVMAARLQGRQPVILTVRVTSWSRQITTEWQARDKRTNEVYAVHAVARAKDDPAFFDILAESGVAS